MEDLPASFSCCDCQRHFPSLPELVRHRELLHSSPSQDTEETDGISRPYRCQQCGRGYRHPGSLINHRLTHETGLFSCTTCGKGFTNPMALKSHIRTHVPEGRRRHRPPRPKEEPSCFQGEMVSTNSWGQKLGPEDDWENQTNTEETPACESGPEPRAAPGNWEDPSTKRREDWESQPDAQEGTKHWGATTGPARAPPLPTPATSLLSNLEQYLAESVVNFTGGQEPTSSTSAAEERRYKCTQCGKTYKHAGSLTNHRQSHTVGIYPCSICFKEFSNLMALKNHSRLHAQYRPYRCPHCPRAFRLPRELLDHQQSHEDEKSDRPWDEKEMPTTNGHIAEGSRNQLPITQLLNSSGELDDSALEEYRPFRCEQCGRTYRHAGSLINHRKSHQTGIYPCPVCSKQLFNAAALKTHVRAHHKPREAFKDEDGSTPVDHRPYKCNECGRAYRHRGSLVNHRHTHRTGEYQCSLCPRKYSNLMALRNHVRMHCKAARRNTGPGAKDPPSHSSARAEAAPRVEPKRECKREEEATDAPPAADGAAPQICSVCGMVFEDPERLERHSQSHRGQDGENNQPEPTVSPPRTFACQDCGKSYRHSSSLINHRQTHRMGDFRCGTCAKHFPTMAAMKNHLRLHSRRRSRCRRRTGSTGGCGGAKPLSEKDWAQDVEDDENPDFPQDLSREGPSGAEDNLDGDCSQADSEEKHRGLERAEARVKRERESRGGEDGVERKENRRLDKVNILGVKHSSGARFCDGLTAGADEDRKPVINLRRLATHSTDAVRGWQAEAAHTCTDCGRSFPHATGLLSHRPCHPPGIYQCSLCPKEFGSLPALRSHFRNHRPGEVSPAQPFLCCLCGMIFPGRAGYRLHRLQAHGCSALTEGSEEEGEEEGAAEAATARSPPLQLLEAELLNQLQREVEALDGAGYGHICGCCGQTYDDLGSLERHHRSLGGALGNTIDKASSHVGESGNGTEMVTDDVREGAVSSVAGEGADMKSGGEGVGATVADSFCMQGSDSSLGAQPRPFHCNQCGKTYRHRGSLVNHRKIHQTGAFTCPVCVSCYPNLAAYRNHVRSHPLCKGSVPQVGPFPGVEGSSQAQNTAEEAQGWWEVEKLQEELKVEPPGEVAKIKEETWEETIVKWEEAEDPQLETAEKNCQTKGSSERPFSCEVRGRSCKHAGSLINHRQSRHTGHFGCQACSKGFSNLMSLKNHQCIHVDSQRFCGGEFGKAFRLRKQLANHHGVHIQRHVAGVSQKLSQEDRPLHCRQYEQASYHSGSPETGQYGCPTYPKMCSNRVALSNYQRLHSERQWAGSSQWAAVPCALRGQGFPSWGSLEWHLQEHEENIKKLSSGRGETEVSEGNLAEAQGLEVSSRDNETLPQLEEDGTVRPGEQSENPIWAVGTEATALPSEGNTGKADGCQEDKAGESH